MRNSVKGAYSQGDVYNKIKRPDTITTQGYLRLEKSLQGTFNTIQFDVLTNQGTIGVTEQRLGLTDTFTITSLAVFLYKAGASTAATAAEKAAAKLRSWNNPLVFTGVGEAANLQAIYNGYLSIKVNSTVFVQSLDMMNFYRVGQAQQGVGPAVITQADEWSDIQNGFKHIVPTITLNGAAKNDIIINLPTSTTTSGTTSENVAVLYARGFLSQNASKLN